MRLLPRSLVGRMTLLVAGVGVLSFVMHMTLMGLWLEAPMTDAATATAGRVRLAAQLLERAAPAERQALAQNLSDRQFRVQSHTGSSGDDRALLPPVAGRLFTVLLAQLPAGSRILLPRPAEIGEEPGMTILVPVDGQNWAFTQRLRPPSLVMLGTGLGWLLLVAVAVFASLALGVRFITRPITQLAVRLQAQGSRIQPVQSLGGASEMQALTTAFNRLAHAVRQADDDRQHLLAGVSHDLRTPLARLRLRVETRLHGDLAEELLAEADTLERIVAQFMAFVQGESGAGLGVPDTVDAVLRQVVAGYAAQGLPVQAQPGGPACELPDLALQRLLSNLIDNALAHGRAPVRVALTERGGKWGRQAVLSVSDAGPGMSAEEFSRAQQPFVRAVGAAPALDQDGLLMPSRGHCGLGLAIVARLAEQLGGTLVRGRDAGGRFAVQLVWPLPLAN